MLLDAVLPELSIEEEVTSLLVAGEAPKWELLVDGLGLGTIRELNGAFDTGAPLPAVVKWPYSNQDKRLITEIYSYIPLRYVDT